MKLSILGTRGIPARHGGFETFAERLALYLAGRGWQVTVYCQDEDGTGQDALGEVALRQVRTPWSGAIGSIVFDWKSTRAASREDGLVLTLGYNTALFSLLYRLKGITNLFNMDGLEWQRAKWSLLPRCWLYINERAACLIGNHLIADHPEIAKHLHTRVSERKVATIPYGSDRILKADKQILDRFDLQPDNYALVIARPEPENSILEIVSAFRRCPETTLVVLGNYDDDRVYSKKVLAAAGPNVRFLGAIYDREIVEALRFFARFYIHGHRVGGTNPSLVEALGAGRPVLAHDNPFNRWVAGPEALYFRSIEDCSRHAVSLSRDDALRSRMADASRERHSEAFTWETVLGEYEALLLRFAERPLSLGADRAA